MDEEYTVRFKPVGSLGRRKEWEDVDIMEGIYVGTFSEDKFDFLPLTEVPVVFTMWKEHPLAKKKVLSFEQLCGQTLAAVCDEEHLSENLKALLRDAEENGVRLIKTDHYDSSTYDTCVLNGYIMLTATSDSFAQHGMISVPFDRECLVPYGLYCRKDASATAAEFISFIKESVENM